MAAPHFENAVGSVDGVNQDFSTSVPYQSGTLQMFINGQLKRPEDDDGFIETSSTTFQTKEIYRADTVGGPEKIQVFYMDTASSEDVVEGVIGIITELVEIQGTINDVIEVQGVVDDVDYLVGTVSDPDLITGVIEEVDELIGVLCECPP